MRIKQALATSQLTSNISSLRRAISGNPSIPLTGNIGLINRLRLLLERSLMRGENQLYGKLIDASTTKQLRDTMLAAAAAGGALGGGSLGWALAKNNPEGNPRFGDLIEALLFEPRDHNMTSDQIEPQVGLPEVATQGAEEDPWGRFNY